jgi:Rad51
LQLCIQVQLPRSLGGLEAGVIYIGTESSLATPRLAQIASALSSTLSTDPPINILPQDVETAVELLSSYGDRIFYYNCSDLEAQEHIVTYQLPVLLSRYQIGLVVLDSVTTNYRAEFERHPVSSQKPLSQPAQMAQRSKDLRKLAGTLKDLAVEWNVAVLAVNQVTDNFKRTLSQEKSSQETELLALDYQSRWFEGGIGEVGGEVVKKPALGFVWANLITQRLMLVRDLDGTTRIKVVFSPFARPGSLGYEIGTETGIYSVKERMASSEALPCKPEEVSDSKGLVDNPEHNEFELTTDDIEFSDSVLELLSGQTNV